MTEKNSSEIIKRVGYKPSFAKEYYYLLMKASWPVTLLVFLLSYLSINTFFALIFFLNPGSISGAGTIFDAFYFSIQTFSTIGYGAIVPNGHIGNWTVALEAFTGMMSMAIMTGLMFAKIARPSAKIIFSRLAVTQKINGQDVFVFRMGNTRGNDIIEATCSVTALCNSYTKEGQHLRRIIDLPLVRNQSPFFNLSWQVMHVIDDASPLKNILSQKPHDVLSINCVLSGHDGTYSQTIYHRHSYLVQDIKTGHVFKDIISSNPDGGSIIDYGKMSDTEIQKII